VLKETDLTLLIEINNVAHHLCDNPVKIRRPLMLKITKQSPARLDIELSGSLDADSMRAALDELIEKSDDIRNGRMLYTISEFSLPTLGAIGVEMTRLPKLFGLLAKFDKCAVLSDSNWLRKAAIVEGALFPGIDIKSFELDEIDAAEAWLAQDGA
tara:strand:- start:13027 stop:13494 length:468 start_codon:yes stop_codon:yes gene_type:complete